MGQTSLNRPITAMFEEAATKDTRWRTAATAMPDGVPATVVRFIESLKSDPSVTYGEFSGLYGLLIETPQAVAGVRRFGQTRPGLWWDPSVFRSRTFSYAAYLSDVLARTRTLIEAKCNVEMNQRLLDMLLRIDLDGTRKKATPPAPAEEPAYRREPVAMPAIIYAGTGEHG